MISLLDYIDKINYLYKKAPIFIRVLFVILSVILFLNIGMRVSNSLDLYFHQMKVSLPVVKLIQPVKKNASEEIILPGTLMAWHDTDIYARINGYVTKWYVDIGSVVKKNDVLAIIDAPEMNAQYRLAKEKYNALKAKNNLAQITATRWKNLLKTDSVSQQETDEKVNLADSTFADMLSAKAEKNRLKEIVKFEKVRAPFSGIISDRHIDIGSLVNSGSNTNSQQPLYHIVKSDKLRLYVKIPQIYMNKFPLGLVVKLKFSQYPKKEFEAKLIRTADAIDLTTRTLLTQFVIHNPKQELLAGSFTTVFFTIPFSKDSYRIPVNALLFRKEGIQVALLKNKETIHLQDIHIYRDFGEFVEVTRGLTEDDDVVLNPSDDIYENQKVVGMQVDKA